MEEQRAKNNQNNFLNGNIEGVVLLKMKTDYKVRITKSAQCKSLCVEKQTKEIEQGAQELTHVQGEQIKFASK